jgi:hypothetical protein
MATLDTLALPNTFRLPQMLRDPHQRINTTSFGHGSYRRTSSGCGHWDIRSYYALQSHVVTSLEVLIFMTSVTPFLFRLRPVELRQAGRACSLPRRTLPMTGNGTTRFVW